MNRKKKLIFGMFLWISVMMLSACVPTDKSTLAIASDNTTYSGTIENYNNDTRFYVYVDPDTGVNYIVFAGIQKGGITPRYNPNGSLFITEN